MAPVRHQGRGPEALRIGEQTEPVNTGWRIAADVVVGVHFAFVGYVVFGGFVAWRWPRTIVTHLLAVVWGVLIVVAKLACPLTRLQNWFRSRAGLHPVHGGFIGHYVQGTFYPTHYAALAQALAAVVVLLSWVGLARRTRAARTRIS